MRYKREIIVGIIILMLIIVIGIFGFKSYFNKESSDFNGEDLTSIIMNSELLNGENGEVEVVCFGNAPFSDGRKDGTDVASVIESETGMTVYNLAFSNSYVSSKIDTFRDKYPFDVFSFYWTATALCIKNFVNFEVAFENLEYISDDVLEVYSTLQQIDMNTVDAVVIMYDGSDYIAAKKMEDEENATNIQTYSGALNAGVQFIKAMYPNVQIILASPAYAYSPDEYGNYADSNTYRYGEEFLYDYVLAARQVAMQNDITFLDMYYLTNNQSEYLSDYIHLSETGREIVAGQIIEALVGAEY